MEATLSSKLTESNLRIICLDNRMYIILCNHHKRYIRVRQLLDIDPVSIRGVQI